MSGVSSVPGIFDAQQAMIEDSSLLSKVEAAIEEQKVNAEWAVKVVTDSYIAKYKAITDEHLRERYIDIEDVADRILNALGGGERSAPLAADSIIVAKELMPSTLAEQSGSHPTAVITEHGGWTSHTFILARELNLPAVTGVKKILRRVDTGDSAIVDGYNGRVILNPTAETLEQYRLPAAQFQQVNYNDVTVADAATHTLDGFEITLRVNVDLPEVYKKAKRLGARGIGLYRSEFLFNRFKGFPTENQQFDAYREIAEFAGEDGVKIRTFDLQSRAGVWPEPRPGEKSGSRSAGDPARSRKRKAASESDPGDPAGVGREVDRYRCADGVGCRRDHRSACDRRSANARRLLSKGGSRSEIRGSER